MSDRERRQEDIDAAAAGWVIRVGGDRLRDEEQRGLERWLAESPAHQAAFDRARSIWAELATLGTISPPGDIVPGLAASGSPAPPWSRYGFAAVARRAAAVLVLLLAATGLTVFWLGNPILLLKADYRTAPGENRSVTLSDGTKVELNTDSALAVRFDGHERRVALLAGEAYFTVAPARGGETRPFVVEAADGITKALGTEFAVDLAGQKTLVTVAEHRVQISIVAVRDSAPRSVVLSSGQGVAYDRNSGIGAVTQVDVEQAMAWRRGYLVFNDVRLADVVAELNRYRRGRIVIANDSLAERRVSGLFSIADLSGRLIAVAHELQASTASVPPFVTLLY